MKVETRRILAEITKKYNLILHSKYKQEDIDIALKALEEQRARVQREEEQNIDLWEVLNYGNGSIKLIFRLMNQYQEEIKNIFIQNQELLTHITDVDPNTIESSGGKLRRSSNRANNYETARGNWFFASSDSIDGSNAYLGRKPRDGMYGIGDGVIVYNGNHMQVEIDKDNKPKVLLKKPNYIYMINPQNFIPVVTLKKDRNAIAFFEFSQEWISEQEYEIDKEQVVEIRDITELIKNYQVLCDINCERIVEKISKTKCPFDKKKQMLMEYIVSGNLRYINNETNINTDHWLYKDFEKRQISKQRKKEILGGIKLNTELEYEADMQVKKDSQEINRQNKDIDE